MIGAYSYQVCTLHFTVYEQTSVYRVDTTVRHSLRVFVKLIKGQNVGTFDEVPIWISDAYKSGWFVCRLGCLVTLY